MARPPFSRISRIQETCNYNTICYVAQMRARRVVMEEAFLKEGSLSGKDCTVVLLLKLPRISEKINE